MNITVKVETKWRENGDNMGTKRRQNGYKMEAKMETKWRPNGGLKTSLGQAGGRGQQKSILGKNTAKSDGVLLQHGVCANIA